VCCIHLWQKICLEHKKNKNIKQEVKAGQKIIVLACSAPPTLTAAHTNWVSEAKTNGASVLIALHAIS